MSCTPISRSENPCPSADLAGTPAFLGVGADPSIGTTACVSVFGRFPSDLLTHAWSPPRLVVRNAHPDVSE